MNKIYFTADLTFLKSEDARHLLEKLPGHKFLIEGNHDSSIRAYKTYFKGGLSDQGDAFPTHRGPFPQGKPRCGDVITHRNPAKGQVAVAGHLITSAGEKQRVSNL